MFFIDPMLVHEENLLWSSKKLLEVINKFTYKGHRTQVNCSKDGNSLQTNV